MNTNYQPTQVQRQIESVVTNGRGYLPGDIFTGRGTRSDNAIGLYLHLANQELAGEKEQFVINQINDSISAVQKLKQYLDFLRMNDIRNQALYNSTRKTTIALANRALQHKAS